MMAISRVEFGRIARKPVMCSHKRAYPSFSGASRAAQQCRRGTGDPVHAYACGVCGMFHVGGSEQRDAMLNKRRPIVEPTLAEQLELWAVELAGVRIGKLSC